MSTQGWSAQDFQGLTPAVDPRRSDKLFALNGANYLWDAIGPRSAFGNRYLTPFALGRPEHVQGARLHLTQGDRSFTFTGDAILEWDEVLGGWRVLYVTPNTTIQPYRWTYGYLNGYMYFCHPRVGILVMDVENDTIVPLQTPGAPEQAIALVINNGRVCAINDTTMFWSAPSNGLDWVPRLSGPGFQIIGDRVAGDPVMITSYTAGTLVWTSGGVMRSEFTGDVEVYRHRPLNTEYRMINSFCSMKLDENTVVILDERGLFQSKGEAPQPFAPVFNEFLINYLQDFDLKRGTNVRIEWDDLQKQVYLSTSLSYTNPLFEECFVYYPPVDKWGQFNEPHFGILPLRVEGSEREDDFFGFVDATGRVRYWSKVGSREVLPTSPLLDGVRALIQKPGHLVDGDDGIVLSSSAVANTVPTKGLTPDGFFLNGGQVRAPAEVVGLNAFIHLGLLRIDQQMAADMMTEVNQLLIGSLISGEEGRTRVNYNLIPAGTSDEDYNLETGGEAFGFEDLHYINHGIRVIGTVDGRSVFFEQVPELVEFKEGIRYYSCAVTGIWHILELTAIEVGEAFHLRAFMMTASGAGRYT